MRYNFPRSFNQFPFSLHVTTLMLLESGQLAIRCAVVPKVTCERHLLLNEVDLALS